MKLYNWQKKAIRKHNQNNHRGIICATTGAGKTRVAIEQIKTLRQTTLIIVPTIPLMNQWKQELLKIGVKPKDLGLYYGEHKEHNKITIGVINSLYEQTNLDKQYSFCVMDEIHRYGAKEWKRLLLNNNFKYTLGLTATLERQDGQDKFLKQKIGGVLIDYQTTQAIKDNLINEFTIINKEVRLPQKEKDKLERLDKKIKTEMKRFDNDMQKVISSLKKKNKYAAKTLRLINKRKKLLNNNKQKIRECATLIKKLILKGERPTRAHISPHTYTNTNKNKSITEYNKDKDNGESKNKENKIIVFSEYIESIDLLYKILKDNGVRVYVYYSGNKNSLFKLSPGEKKEILESFSDDNGGVLLSVKALDEGLDVRDVNIGILLGYNNTSRQAIQRVGRILRKDGSVTPVMYNFYLGGTNEYYRAKKFCERFKGAKVLWK